MSPIFKADDGTEWKSQAKAAQHNKLLAARKKAEDAMKELRDLAAESTITADGEPFTLERREYFRVINQYGWTGPSVVRVRIWPYNVAFDEQDGGIVIREYDHTRREYITHHLKDLYATQNAAIKACIKAAEERLEEIQEQVEEMKAGKLHVGY